MPPPHSGPLDHRRILDHGAPFHPFRGTDLFARLGGQATVDRLVDGLYDRVAADAGFGTLFARDLTAERARQKSFFAEWLGGERRYTDHAYAPLAHRHEELPITPALAGRWLGHFRAACATAVADAGIRSEILARIELLAAALVNAGQVPADRRPGSHGMCIATDHPVMQAVGLAHRGDADALHGLLERNPALLSRPLYAARVMHAAALAGRTEVVRALLREGADANRPCQLPVALAGEALWGVLFVTPLCAARFKRRGETAALLASHGAKDDIFTAAFLGDLAELARQLAADSDLAQASDPAADVLDLTPLHHAVACGRVAAVDLLLRHVPDPVRGLDHALRAAAGTDNIAIVGQLLARGADGHGIGAGRWMLHPQLAPLLARAGASVVGSAWIGLCCTGNQGRKDDPDYVRALLRHGARVDDRRGGATALHFAAKAGFLRTIAVLIEHGADPRARDDNGGAPVDWLERAAKSVDRAAVRRLLAP